MTQWVLPTISEVLASTEPGLGLAADSLALLKGQAEQEWHAAIAAMTQLLKHTYLPQTADAPSPWQQDIEICEPQGLILAGPMPVISEPTLMDSLPSWILTPDLGQSALYQLPPSVEDCGGELASAPTHSIPLLPADPIATEQFCLVLTPIFSWIAVWGQTLPDRWQFQFSFVPETLHQALAALRARVHLTRPPQLQILDPLIQSLLPVAPDYRIPMQFSRLLLNRLSAQGAQSSPLEPATVKSTTAPMGTHSVSFAVAGTSTPPVKGGGEQSAGPQARATAAADPMHTERPLASGSDVELLKAISHEIRTPLTTIQTFTRLLLRRSDLPKEVLTRLQAIQRECRQQIDRFNLIFRAMEATSQEPQPTLDQLTSVSLQQVLNENIPRWQQQATLRNLTLKLEIPESLPVVMLRDPTMLDQVLTGLLERLSHSLPEGSEIELQVALAGEQLKLQLRSHTAPDPATGRERVPTPTPILQAVGRLLMLQPETGGLSLSLPATKHLFQALGGKLTVRHHQRQGEVLTIFLPLGTDPCPQQSIG